MPDGTDGLAYEDDASPNAPDARPPTTKYVQENRDDLMYILKNGDRTLRVLALAVLLEGGREADIELVERELELLQEVDDEWT
jgi:hypothetical protein